jgi:hypothetical protein
MQKSKEKEKYCHSGLLNDDYYWAAVSFKTFHLFVFCFLVLGFEFGLSLARQVLYHFSHTSSLPLLLNFAVTLHFIMELFKIRKRENNGKIPHVSSGRP